MCVARLLTLSFFAPDTFLSHFVANHFLLPLDEAESETMELYGRTIKRARRDVLISNSKVQSAGR